ncbi:MAG: hypothetical protein WDO74_09280 [Pseudomonadota bacterium]
MLGPVSVRTAFAGCLLFACSVLPSRAPLGGNYALPESAPAGDRHAQAEASASARPDTAASEPVTAVAAPSATLAAVHADAVARVAPADALQFEPLQVGSQVKAEVTLSTSAEMRGGPPGMLDNGKLSLDVRLRVEIKVLKASAQSLDEIDLTLTTLSMHSEVGGQGADSKPQPPETYDITLSGPSPTIRARSGAKVDPMERVKIAVLLVPLAEFYAHWARSPTLELKPGWTSKVSLPFAATLFATASNEIMRVGPLSARFTSRAAGSDELPFELGLPVEYSSDLGKIAFDLSGTAKLNAKSARPSAFDLSGPLSATGGPRGAQLSVAGTAKFSGSLSYH